jgi:hypothetical protein
MNSTAPLFAATGRSGLLKRCVAVAIVGLIAVAVSPVLMSHDLPGWVVGVFCAGAVVLVVSVVYALKRTACPQCQMPWLQYALREKGAGEWLSWLTTFTECPQCRYTVEEAVSSSQTHIKCPGSR